MNHLRTILCVATMLLFSEFLAAYKLDISNIHRGEYSYSYETDDGTIMENREGKVDDNGSQVVTGSYTFLIGNSEYSVTYTADNNGFHPRITISQIPLAVPALHLPPSAVATLLGR